MAFLGDIGKAFEKAFRNPVNILVPPLGIAKATLDIAKPLAQQAIQQFRSPSQGQPPANAPNVQQQFSPYQPAQASYYPSYSLNATDPYFDLRGQTPWDYSTFLADSDPTSSDSINSTWDKWLVRF